MTDALRLDPLTAPLSRAEVRSYRLATDASQRAKFWGRVGGFLGTVALIVFLSFYLSDWELSLVPWLAAGLTALFVLAWVLARRSTARRWRLRCRLARFAAANRLTLDVDVPLPGGPTPRPTPADGEIMAVPLRLRGADARGEWAVGLCTCHERSESGRTTSNVERVYLLGAASADLAPDDMPFRREYLGTHPAIVFTETLDLASPGTWERIARFREHARAR